jgi:hypothetical protein
MLSLITSSASCERNFSSFGYIHSKVRNRLKNPKVNALVYIYTNLRALSGNKRKRSSSEEDNNDNADKDDYLELDDEEVEEDESSFERNEN